MVFVVFMYRMVQPDVQFVMVVNGIRPMLIQHEAKSLTHGYAHKRHES